jgi:hypothetical protein
MIFRGRGVHGANAGLQLAPSGIRELCQMFAFSLGNCNSLLRGHAEQLICHYKLDSKGSVCPTQTRVDDTHIVATQLTVSFIAFPKHPQEQN